MTSPTAQMKLDNASPGTPVYRWLERHRVLLECTGALPPPPYKVLDLGSGSGLLAVWAARQGWDVTAVELESDHMAVLRKFLAAEPSLKVTPIVAGIEDAGPKLPDGAFDIIYMKDVLEHVDDYDACIEVAHDKLKPGGLLYAATTNVMCPIQSEYHGVGPFSWYPRPVKDWIMHYAIEKKPEIIMHSRAPALHWFRRGTLDQALRRAGFARTWDVYDLVRSADDLTGKMRYLFPLIKIGGKLPLGRHLVDMLIPGLTMIAQK